MRELAMSLVGFNSKEAIENYGVSHRDIKYELSYLMSNDFLEEVSPIVKNRVSSVHASCPRTEFFPNFASNDEKIITQSFEIMMQTLKTAVKYGAKHIVLHPGYLTNLSMPSDGRLRVPLLDNKENEQYIRFKEGSICKKEYIKDKKYRHHFEIMLENLKKLSNILEEENIKLAVENLNPRVGYLFFHPEEILELAERGNFYFCLDVGHLYISSKVFEFDFLDAIEKLLNCEKVIALHLHSNPSTDSYFEDSHDDIYENNFPIEKIVNLSKNKNITLVLETVKNFDKNTEFLQFLAK